METVDFKLPLAQQNHLIGKREPEHHRLGFHAQTGPDALYLHLLPIFRLLVVDVRHRWRDVFLDLRLGSQMIGPREDQFNEAIVPLAQGPPVVHLLDAQLAECLPIDLELIEHAVEVNLTKMIWVRTTTAAILLRSNRNGVVGAWRVDASRAAGY